jgi:tRNA 2-thiocytidine biosynthesis protein TtcA
MLENRPHPDRPISRQERRLLHRVGRAIGDFALLEDGDRVLVAMSGGKDSYSLLVLLDRLRERAPVRFELVPWHLDQGQPGYDGEALRRWLAARGGEFHVVRQDTYSIVVDKVAPGDTYCALCSRLRRGILYDAAQQLGCTKIALGHHADDSVDTLLLNLFFTGQIKAMPPWLRSDDGRNVVVRPLLYCFESDLAEFAQEQRFPILPCNLCGSQEDLQRQEMKTLVDRLDREHPGVRNSLLAAIGNVKPTHTADPALWGRLGLGPEAMKLAPRERPGHGRGRLRVAG